MAQRHNLWRYSFHSPRLAVVDYRATFFLIAALMHAHVWTFSIAGVAILFFYYIERRKRISFMASLRMALCQYVNMMFGSRRFVRKLKKQTYYIDDDCSIKT